MTAHADVAAAAEAGDSIRSGARLGWRRQYPARYAKSWPEHFLPAVAPFLRPGMTILDVGAGKRPTLTPDLRPEGSTYVGLDVEADELAVAPPGSYDEIVVADITKPMPDYEGRFDLVISFMVFEHVTPMEGAVEQLGRMLKPGGSVVLIFAGGRSLFATLNRVIPHRLSVFLLHRLLGRRPANVFVAHYDSCTATGMERLFQGWSAVGVTPFFRGAIYFRFSRILLALYLAYEGWLVGRDRRDRASHYRVVATR